VLYAVLDDANLPKAVSAIASKVITVFFALQSPCFV